MQRELRLGCSRPSMAAVTASPPYHATSAGPLSIALLPMSSSPTASEPKKTTFARPSGRRRRIPNAAA